MFTDDSGGNLLTTVDFQNHVMFWSKYTSNITLQIDTNKSEDMLLMVRP